MSPNPIPALPWSIIREQGRIHAVDPELIAAIILQESSGRQFVKRYEPAWSTFLKVEEWAEKLGCEVEVERHGQATSHGYMQIMGTVARELGFKDSFDKIYVAQTNIALGAAKLAQLIRRHPRNVLDAVSSYNQGSPVMVYRNQGYVDSVVAHYRSVKGLASVS